MEKSNLCLLISGYDFLEAPRWHEGRLWLSDFFLRRVITADMEGRTETIAEVAGQPSGLGWLPDGRLLVVSMLGKKLLRLENDGSLAEHADLSEIAGGPLNDMVVDDKGRAYVGNFGFDLMGGESLKPAKIALVQPDGSVSEAAEGLYFPNGSMITPDFKTLIVNESFANRMSAFDIKDDGNLGPRRDWARFGPVPEIGDRAAMISRIKVAPDGGVLDAEGAAWIADAIGKRVLRVKEGGHITDEIPTEDKGAFACTLGGPEKKTLFICTAPDSSPRRRRNAGEAEVWITDVDVPGAGLP
ncbi:MAG: SMP-30/gluconolactonase/LRE family protein [Desulfobacterales bacterium]